MWKFLYKVALKANYWVDTKQSFYKDPYFLASIQKII